LEKSFKQLLKEDRTPQKDSSPLVVAVLHEQLALFKHILDNFDANLEQETSVLLKKKYYTYFWGDEMILIDNPIEGGTALYVASTLGYLDFVKELISRGANIQHVTDSKSSPLHGAASYGHGYVCEFLIEQGAIVDQQDELGQTPLSVAAVARNKNCVELLIEKGANVNHRDNWGNTPLHSHVSSELKSIEIVEILVKAGAQNCANNDGFTPAILSSASCARYNVVQCIETVFHLDCKELCDYYSLNAAMVFLNCCVDTPDEAARQWLSAVFELCRANPDLLLSLKPGNVIYDGLQEPTTEDEVDRLFGDDKRTYFTGLMICERILGHAHPITANHIRYAADYLLANFRLQFDKCMELLQRAIDFRSTAVRFFLLPVTSELVSAIFSFSIMVDHGYIPSIAAHFQWGLTELSLTRERKTDIVRCLFRMIAIWIKVQDCIKEPERQEKETQLISKGAQELFVSMDNHSCPVLMVCLQNTEYPDANTDYQAAEIAQADLPLHKAIALFLDLGCSVHCEDEEGNFPLHLAVKLLEDTAPQCVATLLEYGADINAVNFDGKTALDVASEGYTRDGVCSELEKHLSEHLSLQCMAAKVVLKHFSGCYEKLLPPRLVEFVSRHEGDVHKIPRSKLMFF
jgi:Fem-1 family protein b